jgi:hypothetical protein
LINSNKLLVLDIALEQHDHITILAVILFLLFCNLISTFSVACNGDSSHGMWVANNIFPNQTWEKHKGHKMFVPQ